MPPSWKKKLDRPHLRPTEYQWGARKGRAWAEDEEVCARFLRHCGLTNKDIGQILHRSTASVDGKIGYRAGGEQYARFFQDNRHVIAKQFGEMADNYETRGTA